MILRRDELPGPCLCILALLWSCGTIAADGLGDLDLEEYSGRVVLVHFWASWCEPCRRSLPWLATIQERYADQGLVVIGVNEDDDASAAEAFLEEFPVNFVTVRDADGELFETWDIIAMPSSYVIDRTGRVAWRYLGFKTARIADYEAALRDALARRSAPRADDPSGLLRSNPAFDLRFQQIERK